MGQEEIKRLAETRQIYNRKIIGILSEIVEQHPELRFWQIMSILGYELKEDKFNEEPYFSFKDLKVKYTDLIIRNKRENHDKKD